MFKGKNGDLKNNTQKLKLLLEWDAKVGDQKQVFSSYFKFRKLVEMFSEL